MGAPAALVTVFDEKMSNQSYVASRRTVVRRVYRLKRPEQTVRFRPKISRSRAHVAARTRVLGANLSAERRSRRFEPFQEQEEAPATN